jgi:L,D-transpeptidase ErfK/SrfK
MMRRRVGRPSGDARTRVGRAPTGHRRWAWLGLLAAAAASPAGAAVFPLAPGADAVGEVGAYTTRAGDTLPDIARRFDLGYTELVAANPGVDPWLPGAGRQIVLPAQFLLPDVPHRGIVVNLGERRLYYFPAGRAQLETYPIGVAMSGLDSPLGETRIVAKEADPAWIPPASIRAEQPELPRRVAPGPANPLGAYALVLGWPDYLIHGTNKPDGIGRNVSHGCLHLYPEDVARLYYEVRIGTPVRVVDQVAMARWIGEDLFIEVHPNKAEAEALDTGEAMPPVTPTTWRASLAAAAGDEVSRVDWPAAERARIERSGIPVAVIQSPRRASPCGHSAYWRKIGVLCR